MKISQEYVSSYVSYGFLSLQILLVVLAVWLMGHLHRRQGKESPSLANRIEASLFIPYLSQLLSGLVIWVILILIHTIWGWPDTSIFEATNLKIYIIFVLLIYLPLWLVTSIWMWKSWITRWPLGIKDLWLPFVLMMVGSVVIGLLKLHEFYVGASS